MRRRLGYLLATTAALVVLAVAISQAVAVEPGNEHFQRTWARTDQPVAEGDVLRTWVWAPEAFTPVLSEPYDDAPGGQRQVQYFDKARMEINDPDRDPASPFYVTNGLLVIELMTGNLQLGNDRFEQHDPAQVNVAGDPDDPLTYADLAPLRDAPALPDGGTITQTLDGNGVVGDDPSLASHGVTAASRVTVPGIDHQVASPFWEFLNSSGPVSVAGQLTTERLFDPWFYATGYPVTEAYWAEVKVGGTPRLVLLQCFERRCLTYTPGNPEGFVVEAGNVGQHYHRWRYEQIPGEGEPTPTTSPTGTATETAEPTATATSTEEPSPTPALNYAYANEWGGRFNPETKFNQPTGIAIGLNGIVYVAEAGTNRIQMYDTDGYYSIEVGEKGIGNLQFDGPQGVATDAEGNLYVVDQNNHRVQKLDPILGYVTQWGKFGTDNGEFWSPKGIAISDSGQIYVVDSANHRVQRFGLNGEYLGQFGGQGADDGKFNFPADIAIDQDGNVYVTDTLNYRVQKFDATGTYLAKWGTGGAGDGQFDAPQGIAIDSNGNVYVADSNNHRVQNFTSAGDYLSQWGSKGSGDGKFDGPVELAVDAEDNIYVVEINGGQVQKFTSDGAFLDRWRDGIRGRLSEARGLALDAGGNIYVADASYRHVQKFDSSGYTVMYIGDSGDGAGQLNRPVAAVTSPDGYLYVADDYIADEQGNPLGNRIVMFTQDGEFVTEWGSFGTGNGQFDGPYGLALDADGNVYVVDSGNNRVQKFNRDGTRLITQWGKSGNGNGQFNSPQDIAIHEERVYVTDGSNYRVQVFDLDGNYIRQWGSFGSNAGQFNRPAGIAVDANGYVYVTELGPGGMTANPVARVQKFTSDGVFLAQFGSFGSGDGQLNMPYRVEVDAAGNVYVLDSANFRVQQFAPVN